MKIATAVRIYSAIKEVESSGQKIPILTCYKMLRNKKILAESLAPFFEAKDRLILELSGGTGRIEKTDPAIEEYVKQIDALASEEIDFTPDKAKIADFGEINLTLQQLDWLKPMIDDEKEGK